MRTTITITLSLLLLSLVSQAQSKIGSVCIAPAQKLRPGERSVNNSQVKTWTVQIDERPAVTLADQAVAVTDLSDARHLVRVAGDGKPVTSFRFRFADYPSRDLCLAYDPVYETWQLTEKLEPKDKTCSCPK